MSIQNDIRTSRNDLRAISALLGDALSQFGNLFQNEVDLAKAEFGEKVQKVGGALGFIAGGAVLVIPGIDRGGLVAAGVLSDIGDLGCRNRRRAGCDRHQSVGRTQFGAA